jgi:hypothetical protein
VNPRQDDSDINALYQAPLDEFTAARDALAKRSGPDGAAIRKLQKPTAPAWAVNQLYWKRRKIFDRLTAAAESVRTAHGQRLAGKTADVERAELLHRAALEAAIGAIRELLTSAGDPATVATTTAVTETLQALPWSVPPGRLTRPLRPQGFAALAGLLPKGGAAARQVAEVVAIDRSRRERAQSETTSERADRERAERQREAATTERSLRAAGAAANKSEQAFGRARNAVERAEESRDRLAKALDEANMELQRLREIAAEEQRRAKDVAAEVARLEHHLRQLKDDLPTGRAGRK